MKLAAWHSMTLVDYPGNVAAVLFTAGCNLRCPFCHNPELVLPEQIASAALLDVDHVVAAIRDRAGFLDGVVVSGGEPTLQSDLPDFLACLKDLGFLTKLDTNGTRPAMVAALIERRLVDYVAVDVKAPPERYATFTGVDDTSALVRETIDVLKAGSVDFELRTTVAPGLTLSDISSIAEWIAPAKRYLLQPFRVPQESAKRLLDPAWADRESLDETGLLAAWNAVSDRFEEGGVRA